MIAASKDKPNSETAANANLVFVEQAPHEEGFAAHFKQHIKPKLLKIEETYQKTRAEYRIRCGLALGALAIAVMIAIVLFRQNADGKVIGLLAIGALVAGNKIYNWVMEPIEDITANRKQTIIPEVLNFIGDFRYINNGKISDGTLKYMGLFDYWDKYKSENLITGSYYDRDFQFAEAELSDESGDGISQVFKGWLFVLKMPSKLKRTIAIGQKGKVSKWLSDMFGSSKGLHEIPFEDDRIRERYDIYSTDVLEAHRLVTPKLIDAIQKLGNLRGGSSIEFGVGGDLFLLKLATNRNLFEPVTERDSGLTTEDTRRFLEELHEVLVIIEALAVATDPRSDEPTSNLPNPK
ncbi:MAG TPA: DUF3137 domain-containing protein [Thermohalobaculum sp.]|nr:DUF3137 domain-containing protein [Thermohalobaculum sp.]